jgi:uncharacterized membrane protein
MDKWTKWLIAIIVVASWTAAFVAYPHLPSVIASHWNATGQPDRYTSRAGDAFTMTIIATILAILFVIIPFIDPRKNITKFRGAYEGIVIVILLFIAATQAYGLAWNLGHQFALKDFVLPAIGLLFIVMGVLMPSFQPNWFLGIRTPWTLSNDTVWKETHQLGGKLFIVSGVIALAGILRPSLSTWFILVPLIISAIWIVVFSYYRFTQLDKQ